jgi:hypothetical protein
VNLAWPVTESSLSELTVASDLGYEQTFTYSRASYHQTDLILEASNMCREDLRLISICTPMGQQQASLRPSAI